MTATTSNAASEATRFEFPDAATATNLIENATVKAVNKFHPSMRESPAQSYSRSSANHAIISFSCCFIGISLLIQILMYFVAIRKAKRGTKVRPSVNDAFKHDNE